MTKTKTVAETVKKPRVSPRAKKEPAGSAKKKTEHLKVDLDAEVIEVQPVSTPFYGQEIEHVKGSGVKTGSRLPMLLPLDDKKFKGRFPFATRFYAENASFRLAAEFVQKTSGVSLEDSIKYTEACALSRGDPNVSMPRRSRPPVVRAAEKHPSEEEKKLVEELGLEVA